MRVRPDGSQLNTQALIDGFEAGELPDRIPPSHRVAATFANTGYRILVRGDFDMALLRDSQLHWSLNYVDVQDCQENLDDRFCTLPDFLHGLPDILTLIAEGNDKLDAKREYLEANPDRARKIITLVSRLAALVAMRRYKEEHGHQPDPSFERRTRVYKTAGHVFSEGGLKPLGVLLALLTAYEFISGGITKENRNGIHDYPTGLLSVGALCIPIIFFLWKVTYNYAAKKEPLGIHADEEGPLYYDPVAIVEELAKLGIVVDFDKGTVFSQDAKIAEQLQAKQKGRGGDVVHAGGGDGDGQRPAEMSDDHFAIKVDYSEITTALDDAKQAALSTLLYLGERITERRLAITREQATLRTFINIAQLTEKIRTLQLEIDTIHPEEDKETRAAKVEEREQKQAQLQAAKQQLPQDLLDLRSIEELQEALEEFKPLLTQLEQEEKAIEAIMLRANREAKSVLATETIDGLATGSAILAPGFFHLASSPDTVERVFIWLFCAGLGLGAGYIKGIAGLLNYYNQHRDSERAKHFYRTGEVLPPIKELSTVFASRKGYIRYIPFWLPLLIQGLHAAGAYTSTAFDSGVAKILKVIYILGALMPGAAVKTAYDVRNALRGTLSADQAADALRETRVIDCCRPRNLRVNPNGRNIFRNLVTHEWLIERLAQTESRLIHGLFAGLAYAPGLFFIGFEAIKKVLENVILPRCGDAEWFITPHSNFFGGLSAWAAIPGGLIALAVVIPQTRQCYFFTLEQAQLRRQQQAGAHVEDGDAKVDFTQFIVSGMCRAHLDALEADDHAQLEEIVAGSRDDDGDDEEKSSCASFKACLDSCAGLFRKERTGIKKPLLHGRRAARSNVSIDTTKGGGTFDDDSHPLYSPGGTYRGYQ